ncbi:MAG: aminopeptidase N [Planctomycetes bacterium]|nr:aminopeptidase N [Planctomycetota bacterium]
MADSTSATPQATSLEISAASAPVEKFRKDYQIHPFQINGVELDFDLQAEFTVVQSRLQMQRRDGADTNADLVLDGEGLETLSVRVDGVELSVQQYTVAKENLTVRDLPANFLLEIQVKIYPGLNTQLSGLYLSSGNYCTQCEAEGFRRITWFMDRPDIMTHYRVRMEGDQKACPVLLSNGNLIESGAAEQGGRHYAIWEDPFPKPSYLFALVAGDLGFIQEKFTTCSGRDVDLYIYSEHRNVDRLQHAMDSLKRSMKWDEDVFGLEYDLDIYNIVAVEDFNMGAMENKSLNVFNTVYVLASRDTATDSDFDGVESVIGHEYFHNWTGNRVTCRDWFQLTLKEGLTVFRDQEFSADMGSRAVQRIDAVRTLRNGQFPEDAGPMAHPIRPDSYIAMDNFYTATVYIKGAEVIRMYQTLLGRDGFRKGLDLYFERHDGQAVTCDDFRAAMADANQVDLTQFERWYTQAGTPVVEAKGSYDAAAQRYTLSCKQSCPATPGQEQKLPFHIPLAIGLLDDAGKDLIGTQVLQLTKTEQDFHFDYIPAEPIASVSRGFSAPVKLRMQRSSAELAKLFALDTDSFCRWEAGQELATRTILEQVDAVATGAEVTLPDTLRVAFAQTLQDQNLDAALRAYALVLPATAGLGEEMEKIDPRGLHLTRCGLRNKLGHALHSSLLQLYHQLAGNGDYQLTPSEIGRRQLRNLCLAYLVAADVDGADVDGAVALAKQQFADADNMTDSLAALGCLVDHSPAAAEAELAIFEKRWLDNALVMDKWFALQAGAANEQVLDQVIALMGHPNFSMSNPNKVRSLLRSFAANNCGFHRADGAGYQFLADRILELDKINPQIASRLVAPLGRWKRYREPWASAMKAQLQRIQDRGSLSNDTFEMVSKSLA